MTQMCATCTYIQNKILTSANLLKVRGHKTNLLQTEIIIVQIGGWVDGYTNKLS